MLALLAVAFRTDAEDRVLRGDRVELLERRRGIEVPGRFASSVELFGSCPNNSTLGVIGPSGSAGRWRTCRYRIAHR
jgi:hypothetical protein